jgi:uncharacterized repeat protein (TIGR03803 family)
MHFTRGDITMKTTLKHATLLAAFAITTVTLATTVHATDRLAVLHTFAGGALSGDPAFQLVADSAGNLYGTTFSGGNMHACNNQGCGAAYRLSPSGSHWTYTELYQFTGYQGGAEPTGLILDSAGNLYGELSVGGPNGNGLVFELSPTTSGPWKFTVVYAFSALGNDGALPIGGLVFDQAGNLYGATAMGGSANCLASNYCGAAFELSPNGSGGWNETVIHAFNGSNAAAGLHPTSNLAFDAAGSLYGTTTFGGNFAVCNCGVVYQLQPSASGWVFNLVYTFVGGTGGIPQSGLAVDAAGNLYGTAVEGGGYSDGVVYELSPTSGGWTYSVVYSLPGHNNGVTPYSPVIVDAAGNIYGAALGGPDQWGLTFELSPTSSGWTHTVSHIFTGGYDGGYPNGLTLDAAGNLYGVANYGATAGCLNDSGCGTVFKLSPLPATK